MDYKQELDSLIQIVIREGASDLHLSEGRNPTIRVASTLIPLVKKAELSVKDTQGFMEVLLDAEQKATFLEKKELDFAYEYETGARFRCNCFVQRGSVGIAMRLIPNKIRSFEELGLPPVLGDFAMKEQGFFLVVGPVGQGKTTTLATMIEHINQLRPVHIVTIEDPIEYIYEQKKAIIDQREVGIDTDNFQTALRSVFRQDVDVVLVGEMRGPETISTAVTAAETGHLVLSTLHTNDAPHTIDRIIDSFQAEQQAQIRAQLAASLTGIFSQRLVPRTSGGVVPVYELLINNNAVANLIRESRVHEIASVIETGGEQGMVDMNRMLAERTQAGEISLEDARRFSLNPEMLEKLM